MQARVIFDGVALINEACARIRATNITHTNTFVLLLLLLPYQAH